MESSPLPCQVCSRPLSPHLPFFCITCARNIVYEPRLEHAQALLQKEALNNEISRAIHAGNSPSVGADKRGSQAREDDGTVDCIAVERARSQRAESVNRTQMLHAENNSLRSETKKLKDAIADRRRDLDKRKTAHNVAVKALDLQEAQAVAPLQNEIAARELKGNKVHEQTAGSRMLLCREAASLCGLQQRKRRKGTSSRDVYFLGGVPVVDLRDLNNADPSHVNVSLSNLAHLLRLASHYLSLRLPAELLLPTASSTHPIIHTPLSSYKFPTLPAGRRAAAAASASPTLQHQPRDRVLHLERPLHALATEDPRAYSLFVDAVTLLAWDVAWLARTQGVDVGACTWEEVCNMGRTLWTLFVTPPLPLPPPPPTPTPKSLKQSPRPGFARLVTPIPSASSTTTKATVPASRLGGAYPDTAVPVQAPERGQLTHGTAHGLLPAAGPGGGADWMRGWHFASHVRLIERIKGALASERMGAEWEVLEKDEWEQEGTDLQPERTTEAVKDRGNESLEKRNARLGDRQLSELDSDASTADGMDKGKTKKGWTKVRSPLGTDA